MLDLANKTLDQMPFTIALFIVFVRRFAFFLGGITASAPLSTSKKEVEDVDWV